MRDGMGRMIMNTRMNMGMCSPLDMYHGGCDEDEVIAEFAAQRLARKCDGVPTRQDVTAEFEVAEAIVSLVRDYADVRHLIKKHKRTIKDIKEKLTYASNLQTEQELLSKKATDSVQVELFKKYSLNAKGDCDIYKAKIKKIEGEIKQLETTGEVKELLATK